MVRQLLDFMHHAVQLPLSIHLGFSAQRKAVQALIAAQVTKHRFHCRKPACDHQPTRIRIDFLLHPLNMILLGIALALQESNLPYLGFLGCAQAFMALRARHAILFGTAKFHCHVAVDRAIRSVAIEPRPCGANAV